MDDDRACKPREQTKKAKRIEKRIKVEEDLKKINEELSQYYEENSFQTNPGYKSIMQQVVIDFQKQTKRIFKDAKHDIVLFGSAAS